MLNTHEVGAPTSSRASIELLIFVLISLASISKIVEGRVTGFVKEVSLLEQAFAKDAKKTVQQILDEAKTAVSAFNRFRVGQ